METLNRRVLRFEQLDDIIDDLDQLLTCGYISLGNWDLAQVCRHLEDWIGFSLDGYPKTNLPTKVMLSLMRVTTGRKKLQQVLSSGKMDAGMATIPSTVHSANEDGESAAEQYTEMIERLKLHSGPLQASPLFGELTREEGVQLQMIHAAHHLSFLIPNESDTGDEEACDVSDPQEMEGES